MKLKQILAGVLTAAMVITSAPVAGLGTISAQAAEETTYSSVGIKMGAAESWDKTGESGENGGWAIRAVDGDNTTYWHSNYGQGSGTQSPVEAKADNSYYIALDAASSVDKITYLPRQVDNYRNGTILKCEVYVTTDALADMPSLTDTTAENVETKNTAALNSFKADSVTWKKVEISTFATASWADSTAEKEILFTATEENVTGIKITVLSSGGDPSEKHISAAEFDVYKKNIVQTNNIAGVNVAIEAPAKGMAPQTAVAETSEYTGTITWKDGADAFAGAAFEGNKAYTAVVTLTAKAGYAFTADTTAQINSEAATPKFENDTLVIEKTFAETSDVATIAKPNLSMNAPMIGVKPAQAVDKNVEAAGLKDTAANPAEVKTLTTITGTNETGFTGNFTVGDYTDADNKLNLAGSEPFVYTFKVKMPDTVSGEKVLFSQTSARTNADGNTPQYKVVLKEGTDAAQGQGVCVFGNTADKTSDTDRWPQATVAFADTGETTDGWLPVVFVYTGKNAEGAIDNTSMFHMFAGTGHGTDRYNNFEIAAAAGDLTFANEYPIKDFKLYKGEEAAAAAAAARKTNPTRAAVEGALENKTPALNLSFAEAAEGDYTVSTVWTKTNDAAIAEDETVTMNDTYKATITLTPKTGMAFADASKPDSIEIDGTAAELGASDVTINDAGNMVITVSFPKIKDALDALKAAFTDEVEAAKANPDNYTTATWNNFSLKYDLAKPWTLDDTELTGMSTASLLTFKKNLEDAFNALEEITNEGDAVNTAVYIPATALTGSADSIETTGEGTNGAAEKAVDGDHASYWHTNWKSNEDPKVTFANGNLTGNNNYYIELDKAYKVSGIRYLPRPNYDPSDSKINNGAILKCNIYVAKEKNADGAWNWVSVKEGQVWDAYPDKPASGEAPSYTTLRRYAEFDAQDDVKAIRIEAINTAGSQPNQFINAAEIDVLAESTLYTVTNATELALLDAIRAQDVQAVVAAGNADNRWSTESWNTFVDKYNAALEIFRDLYDETAKNEDGTLNATVFTTAATEMQTAFAGLEAPCKCTVTVNSVGIDGVTGNVLALGDDESKTYTLTASVAVAANGCTHEGHTDGRNATVTYTATGSGASVSGTTLTVRNTATSVKISATATCDGVTSAAKEATYTVTSNKAKNELSAKIADAKKIEQGDKTKEAFDTLQAAIKTAEDVLNNADATDAQFNAATTALSNAIRTFNNSSAVNPGGDEKEKLYDDLGKLIDDAKAKNDSGLYTTETANALVAVYNEAVKTYNKAIDGNNILHLENVTAEELDKAIKDLQAAISKLVTKEADLKAAQTTMATALAGAKKVVDAGQGTYTDATWKAFTDAYAAAQKAAAGKDAAAIKQAAAALAAAQKALVKGTAAPAPVPGQKVELANGRYEVISVEKKTVRLLKAKAKKSAKMGVAASISINGVKYTVTEVGAKAFKGIKTLKQITLSKNIKTIGKQAFSGCKKLSKVVVKSTVLKTIKSGAFKGTSKKMTVTFKSKKVKAKTRKALLKKMQKAGMSKSAKLK